MEQSGTSSSSKVTVEYSDPSGIFSLVSNDLRKSFPLRNLHWNSSSRPVRFIDSLHVELIKDDQRISQSTPITVGSDDAVHTRANGGKERRHQIPGLRRTPYLKVYLLRCNDNETYKTTSRELLREWVKDHTPPSQSSSSTSKAENHDAFEWLIIHVLLSAGDVTRLTGSSKGDNSAEKPSSTSRWPNRSSSTVIERIRSDFNGSSKTAIDRVAQIQVGDNLDESVPSEQQSQEDMRGFKDLISKLKFLILASFDQRVSQYEEDIREKDSQRNLPGWNFNTFFVLKEGLARGFESVGLVEDALTSYHELSTNLNQIVAKTHTKVNGDHTNPFREFTEDLFDVFKWAVSTLEGDRENLNTSRQLQDLGESLLNTDRMPYRELILENNISAFDFLCYVFARKVSLQLRLANVRSLNQIPSNEPHNAFVFSIANKPVSKLEALEVENLLILVDICQQTLEFITSVTPTIRMDLKTSTRKFAQYLETNEISESVCYDIVENIIASWTFSTSQMMLEKTSVQNIYTQMQPLMRQFKSHNDTDETFQEKVIDTSKSDQQKNFPNRTSSLPPHTSESVSPPSDKFPSITSPGATRQPPPTLSQTGSQFLAAQQADLYILARRSLGSLGLRHGGWKGSWSEFADSQPAEDVMTELSLEDDVEDMSQGIVKSPNKFRETTLLGLQNETLRLALVSKSAFHTIFEDLTASASALFVLGDRPKSAEAMTADLAAARFRLEDYVAAASYFHQLAPFYAKEGWSHLETNMLDMYAQCLKKMGRDDDYIRIGLKIVAKLAGGNATASRDRWRQDTMSFSLTELISASRKVDHAIAVPMDSYFGSIVLDPYPRPYDDHDGFQLQIQVHSLMQEVLEPQHIQMNLVSVDDDHRSELCLTTNVTHSLKPGITKVLVGTNITIPGWYALDKILIKSGNIVFTREFFPSRGNAFLTTSLSPASSGSINNTDQFRVLVWPQSRALDVRLSLCNTIHLEHPRSLHVEIITGWNDVTEGKVSLRAGSAGLRLHIADAVLASGDTTLLDQSQPGDIVFGSISADANLVLRVPYGLESDLKEITVKVEVSFTTLKGTFMYCCSPTIPILLPLGVNVQDIFQQGSLFSKFTISTANAIPLCVSKCHLQGSSDFEVTSPPLGDEKFEVFTRQPLSFISSICRKPRKNTASRSDQAVQQRLLLQIEYHCLDQEISETIERSLLNSLAAANLLEISRLLIPNLLAKYRSKLSIQDFETAGLLRETDISTILDSIWAIMASGVRPECRDKATKWLRDCHKEHTKLSIPKNFNTDSRSQYLTVPVDIAQIGAVHKVSIQLLAETATPTKVGVVGVGQPIAAELVITHTRKWFDQNQNEAKNKTLEFCYDIQASLDTWLIGGQRKARFVAKEDETLRFQLLLIPQRTGHLLYPSVDISTFHEVGDGAGGPNTSSKALYVSETDYRNQGNTLHVVSDLSSTTVSLDPGSSAGGAWLVESKSGLGTT